MCRKIKPISQFSTGETTICKECWKVMNDEFHRKRPTEKKISQKQYRRRATDPTLVIQKMRKSGCKCSIPHLLKLFCEKSKKGWEHEKSCIMHQLSIKELIKK